MDKLNDQEKFEVLALATLPIQIAIVYILIGIIKRCIRHKMKKEYTYKVMSRCVSQQELLNDFSSRDSGLYGMRTAIALLRFEYNGKEYTVTNGFASTNQPYSPGDYVEILINPSDPGKSYLLSDDELPRYRAKAWKTMDKKSIAFGCFGVIAFYAFTLYIVINALLND